MDLDTQLLAVAGVTRLHRPGANILRILVDPLDAPKGQLALGEPAPQRNRLELFDIANAALSILGDQRPPHLDVQFEPGEPPEFYEIVTGYGHDGDSPDPGPFPVYPGAAPTREWTTYAFRSPDLGDGREAGTAREGKARAIDDAWIHFAEDSEGP